MSIKDNLGILLINFYVQVQFIIMFLDFLKIVEDGQDGVRIIVYYDNLYEFFYILGDVVFFVFDVIFGWIVVYVLEESIIVLIKKVKVRLFEGDLFNFLIFYIEGVVEINVKDIGGFLEEIVRGDGNIELIENEFIRYQLRMIECVDVVIIEEVREISEGLDID